jgi:predicted nucleotidyltransferase component of viral defense system
MTRQQLAAINKQTLRYPLEVAEKDYFLTVAVALIADSPLREMLVFKGGTALHHCYLPQYRFSEDIDFSTRVREGLTVDLVQSVLERENVFRVRKKYVSTATIKFERLLYAGILGQAGAIKVEIDHLQNVVLPAVERTYTSVWDLPIRIPVMDIREICAEKLRAASQRSRYRDFYDLFLIFEAFPLDRDEILALMRRKEVRLPITVEGIRTSWKWAVKEFEGGVDMVHISRSIPHEEMEAFLETIQFEPILPEE